MTFPAPGTRAAAQRPSPHLGPAPVVLLEGHLLLVDERVRALADLRIFLDCDVEVRVLRRIARDVGRPNGSWSVPWPGTGGTCSPTTSATPPSSGATPTWWCPTSA